MSSEASIDRREGDAADAAPSHEQLQPWQFFTLAGLAGATAVVFVTREATPAAVVLLSLIVGAAACVGIAAWRMLGPLGGEQRARGGQLLGGRTRIALEREKTLVLRAIKDLEFDRAMGKVADGDFTEMSARLRARASGLLRQLDRGAGYRSEIERELATRLKVPPARARSSCACGTANDSDARFCKACGQQLNEGSGLKAHG
jgi:hypothetical protein